MVRRVHMRADMHTGAHARDIIMPAVIHGLEFFKLQFWVAGPDGEMRRNCQRDVVDGHEELLYTSHNLESEVIRTPKAYGVGVLVGVRLGVPENAGTDIGVSVGVTVGVGVGL